MRKESIRLNEAVGRAESWLVLALAFTLVLSTAAKDVETTNNPILTLDRIFDSDDFKGDTAGPIVWRHHDPGYFTLDKPESGGDEKALLLVDPETGRKETIVPAHAFIPPGESGRLSIASFELSEDESKLLLFTNTKRVWRQHTRGDYWVLDITSRELRKLGGDAQPSTLMFARFSPDGKRVAYVRENNIYVQDLRDLRITPLTKDGSKTLINGTFDWVYEEELGLRDGFRWSPDGQSIAYWQIDSSGVREFQLLNNTDSFYPRSLPIPYPKTGERNSSARVGVVSAHGGETRWMSVPGDPREHYIARMDWASNSTEVILQQFNRPQNTNRVMLAKIESGETRTVLTETDSAWLESENPVRWIDDGEEFVWLSERDGWRHAFKVSREGDRVSRITPGNFDVIDIEAIDDQGGWLYYAASPDNPTQRYLYRIRLEGGKPERLTPTDQPGTHSYNISPDARWAVHTCSRFGKPPVTALIRLPEHAQVRELAENKKLAEAWDALNKPAHEFFRVDIGDGVELDGWCVKPPEFNPSHKYPVLFYVYGETAGQTVLDSWSGKRTLWHAMLAQQGYVVMSVDNRGTPAPRGREWRKIAHRQIGILTAADQAAALRAISQRWSWVDTDRVGVWGWSGGGSMTLNLILQYPNLYHVGMSVAPVPNQRYYDTIYQERYMGLPEDNPDGYRRGSPITYAHQLKGDLLLVHGTGDDNVHYQGMEALINELITYNKPFSMMAYPNRSHSISEGKNTSRHLFSLLTRFLHEHLPASSETQPQPENSGKERSTGPEALDLRPSGFGNHGT